jgi:hypothetical protein
MFKGGRGREPVEGIPVIPTLRKSNWVFPGSIRDFPSEARAENEFVWPSHFPERADPWNESHLGDAEKKLGMSFIFSHPRAELGPGRRPASSRLPRTRNTMIPSVTKDAFRTDMTNTSVCLIWNG